MIDITSKKVVTTRKEHPCFGCTEAINKGASAVYVTAKEDEQHKRFHLHEDCNKKIVKDKRFSGSGLYKGCIKDAENQREEVSSINFIPNEELPFLAMKFNNRAEI
ncbi:hypothetical protein [Lysinibacillus sphaericus]|uniref:Uncharacterized protein n=1 Tax=Lysinibacillus sphaericus OT4b.31 TaxID=1285586 RepID=R7ZCR4_LYSSH|nr:hypothetical protein [Lysinibacillus sphaericus]EON71791.1 hypothetical protein H131_14948 [Lysinibacillus sphaericus OT4b.31]